MTDLGQKLREVRKRRGDFLQDYAPRLGISLTALATRERGHVPFRHEELPKVAEVYGVSKERLVGWIWEENTPTERSPTPVGSLGEKT